MALDRYLSLWLVFARNSLIRDMQYKTNFIIQLAIEILWSLATVFLFEIMFFQTDSVASWTKGEVYFLYGLFRLLSSLGSFIYRRNIDRFIASINSGDFDMLLIKPVNTLFITSTRIVSFNRFSQVAIAIGILIYATQVIDFHWNTALLGLAIILVFFGVMIRYCVAILINLPVFWWERADNLRRLEFSFFSTARYPREVFPFWLRHFFTIVVPTLMVAAIPTEIILGRLPIYYAGYIGIFSLGLFIFTLYIFQLALRNYTSASS